MRRRFQQNLATMQSTQAQDIVRNAVAAFNSGRHQDAQKLCEQGLEGQPREPTLNHLLAAMLFKRGEISSARQRIATSLTVNAKNPAALLLAGRIARSEKDFDAALSYLKRAAALGTNREVLLETARTLDQAGAGREAQPAWRAVLQAFPHSHEAMARLGRLCWEAGALSEASQLLERAVAGDCPASAWFDLGVVRQDLGDQPGAAAAYRQALTKNPAYAEAAVNLGIALQESGDLDAAMRAYQAGYRIRPATFGTIAMALTSAPNGKLWLNEQALRELLSG
jgi:tetratricopeptide (TPR) repeat protein